MATGHTYFQDLTGQRFGRLEAIAFERRQIGQQTRMHWRCRCDCGNEITTAAYNVTHGLTTSCGCRRVENGNIFLTHGAARASTLAYRSWRNAKSRCFNEKAINYARYGGRGITMCARWRDSFEAFLADMGECPSGMSIDRYPDTNGNYEASNCRWATKHQQARNTRASVRIDIDGESLPLAEVAERYGVPYYGLWTAVRRRHEDPTAAIARLRQHLS